MAFRKQAMMNFQIQLTKRQGIVPMTRDYIAREELRLRTVESDVVARLKTALARGWGIAARSPIIKPFSVAQ